MSAEENKALALNAIKEFNEGNLEKYLEYYDENVMIHGYPPELPPNLEGLKQFYAMMLSAFPDAQVEIEDMIAEGDEIATRYTLYATHRGDFLGIPPTGRQIVMDGMTILSSPGGKCVERWQNADMMGLMQQLGAIPTPEQAEA